MFHLFILYLFYMKENTPKLSNMTEKEIKEWKLKMKRMQFSSDKKYVYDKIAIGRGWIF